MKKFLIVTTYVLLMLAGIAYTVGIIFFPEQLALFNTEAERILNIPIVTICGATITIGVLLFIFIRFIFKNTKFGRKELDNMKNEYESLKKDLYKHIELSRNEFNYKINELKDLKIECENKVTVAHEEFKELKVMMLDSLKTIPNKKIQEKIAEYEDKFDEKEQEIVEKTLNGNAYIDEKIQKMEKEFHNALLKLENKYEEQTRSIKTEE